ncbi:hypothetical protein DMA11_16230 [Marinilabiliaceae bacterium JC017]|nr:hypothetical protein DMA11_16230 [Marinilabiliaceae bacterium JC017]
MNNNSTTDNGRLRLWRGVALVAGVFSLVICSLVIANYIQLQRLDPVNTEVINSLVERLSDHPNDNELRTEIRELDLLARKAYFTNQWQIRFGGYLLLMGIAILMIALQMIRMGSKTDPEVPAGKPFNVLRYQQKTRRWVAISGIWLVLVTLAIAVVTHQEMENKFAKAAIASNAKSNMVIPGEKSSVSEETEQPQEVPAADAEVKVVEKKPEVSKATKEKEENNIIEEKKAVSKPVISKKVFDYPTKAMKVNYPSFRGPGGNGIAYQNNIPTQWDGASGKNILWKTSIPLHGYNSPVIWGDKVFLSGADANNREIYCFNRKTGKVVWTAKADNITDSPAKAPGVTDDTGHAAASVTTDGKRVCAIFSNGDVLAVDMKGKRVWARNLGVPSNHYGHSSSLVMVEDKLIVQYDHRKSAQVMALAVQTGETLWKTERKVKISWASPVVVGTTEGAEVLLSADPFIASYNASTGEELWKLDCMSGEVGPSVAYADGIVFALNEYASLVAIKAGPEPEILWEAEDYLSDVPSPVATEKYLFVATSYGLVVCYDAKTGEQYWEKEFDKGFYASPVLVDGKIYLLDRDGIMHIFKPDNKFVAVSDPSLGEKSVCTPAFSDGHIYIRAGKNLYCIGK